MKLVMNPKLNALRALAAYSAILSLRLITTIIAAITASLLGITVLLAIFVSPWWLLLLVPIVIVALVAIVMRLIIKSLINRIHRHPFTTRQREQLEAFTDKIATIAEVRNMTAPLLALQLLWDILRHREETTIEKVINDSTTLKESFAELEKHFGER